MLGIRHSEMTTEFSAGSVPFIDFTRESGWDYFAKRCQIYSLQYYTWAASLGTGRLKDRAFTAIAKLRYAYGYPRAAAS